MSKVFNKLIAFKSTEEWFLLSAYFMSFSFSLTPFLSSLALTIFIIFSLPNFQRPSKSNLIISDVVLLGFLFLLYVLFLSLTPSLDRALKLTYRILPIFIIPIIIFYTNLHLKINYNSLKKYFIIGVVISCILSLAVGIINSIQYSSFEYLFYFKICEFLHIHPTYFALYILSAIHFIFKIQDNFILRNKIWITILFLLFIFLLQSKIALIVLVSYSMFVLIYFKKNRIKTIVFMVLFWCLFIIGLCFKENRFNEFFIKREAIEIGNLKEDGVSQRAWLWNEAYRQIKKRPLMGYGLGSQSTIFKWNAHKNILENEMSYSNSRAVGIISELNLHNQFIQVFYELGFLGISFYIISIILLVINAIKMGNQDFLVIISFFLIFMLTENLHERQMGIYFYSFIISLLYFEMKKVDYDSK